MRKLLLALFIIAALAGCETYQVESNTTFNLVAVENDINLYIEKNNEYIQFKVMNQSNILEADECILRNDNTHELYANFGDYENIVYVLHEDGYYTFGFYKDEVEVIYSFKLSELEESQTINYRKGVG